MPSSTNTNSSTVDENNHNDNHETIPTTTANYTPTQNELDQKLFDAIESEDPIEALGKLKELYPVAESGDSLREGKLDANCRGSGKHYGSYPLHAAVSLGKADVLSYLLNNLQADPNILDDDGLAPLHKCAEGGPGDPKNYAEMAKRLLDGGADPDVWSADGSVTPIHVAAEFGQTDVAKELMKDVSGEEKRLRAGNVNLRDGRGRTAASIASERNMTDLASLLLSAQPTEKKLEGSAHRSPGLKTNDFSLLHRAVEKGKVDAICRYLDKYPENVNEPNENGFTPLHLAASSGSDYETDTVQVLIERGADLNMVDSEKGDTALHFAASGGEKSTCKLLLKNAPFLVSARNRQGEDPLHAAIVSKNTTNALLLIQNGADIGASMNSESARLDRYGRNFPLHYAARFGLDVVVDAMLSKGALVDPKNKDQITPFLLAASHRHQKTVELLVANGAHRQAQDVLGHTALHIAVSKLPGPRPQEQEAALRFISFLLEKIGVNPLIQATNGETALHVAVRVRNLNYVRLLLRSAGPALVNIRDEMHHTALHLLFLMQEDWADSDSDIVRELLLAGADPNIEDDQGWTPLHIAGLAAFHPPMSMLEELIKADQIDLNIRDKTNEGNTPLHYFALNGHVEGFKLLVKSGARFQRTNKKGQRPVDSTVNKKIKDYLRLRGEGMDDNQIEKYEEMEKKKELAMQSALKKTFSPKDSLEQLPLSFMRWMK